MYQLSDCSWNYSKNFAKYPPCSKRTSRYMWRRTYSTPLSQSPLSTFPRLINMHSILTKTEKMPRCHAESTLWTILVPPFLLHTDTLRIRRPLTCRRNCYLFAGTSSTISLRRTHPTTSTQKRRNKWRTSHGGSGWHWTEMWKSNEQWPWNATGCISIIGRKGTFVGRLPNSVRNRLRSYYSSKRSVTLHDFAR